MADEKLNTALQLMQAGDRQQAVPILRQMIVENPSNESAWMLLYECVDEFEHKKYCLRSVLSINPNHEQARIELDNLMREYQKSAVVFKKDEPAPQPKPQQQSKAKEESDRPVWLVWNEEDDDGEAHHDEQTLTHEQWQYRNEQTRNEEKSSPQPVDVPEDSRQPEEELDWLRSEPVRVTVDHSRVNAPVRMRVVNQPTKRVKPKGRYTTIIWFSLIVLVLFLMLCTVVGVFVLQLLPL